MKFFITAMFIQFGQPVPLNALLDMPVDSTIEECVEQVKSDLSNRDMDVLQVSCEEYEEIAPPN